jgi:hypothetical protein
MNGYIRWCSVAFWIGIAANVVLALTGWFAPERLLAQLKLEPTPRTVWVRNMGMLLAVVTIFNAAAALDPMRYPLISWMVPLGRLIGSSFFFLIIFGKHRGSTERPKSFIPLLGFDLTMAVLTGTLLYKGKVGLRGPR